MFKVITKLKFAKAALKPLNLNKYCRLETRVTEARNAMEEAQMAWEMNCSDKDKQKAVLEKQTVYLFLQNLLLSQLRQIAKLDQATDGDKNTSFFQAMINHRRKTNKIHVLYDDFNSHIEDLDQLKDHIVRFYKSLITQVVHRGGVDQRVFRCRL